MPFAICGFLSSCSVSIPDAAYLDGQERFSNAYVSDHMIHGKWMKFSTSTIGYMATQTEDRCDYEFLPGGRGRIREVTQYHGSGHRIILEAPIRWEKTAPNRWMVMVPASDKFKVVETNGPQVSGPQRAHSFQVLYANGRLYDVDSMRTLVPIDQARRYIDEERARIKRGESMPILIGVNSEG